MSEPVVDVPDASAGRQRQAQPAARTQPRRETGDGVRQLSRREMDERVMSDDDGPATVGRGQVSQVGDFEADARVLGPGPLDHRGIGRTR